MWQTDPLTEAVWHAATAATNASRFAEDVELYGSDEFGLLAIGDELCRASALMPQKRNPYALVVIRGGAGTLLGRATGVLATQRTPSGRTDNLLYAYGEVCGAVDLATRLVDLAAATAESLRIDRAACERALRESSALATDVAEVLSLELGLDYRSAYRVVGRAVAQEELTADGLERAATEAARPTAGDRPRPRRRCARPRARAGHPHGHGRRRARADGRDAARCPGRDDRGKERLEVERRSVAAAEQALVAQARTAAAT